MKSFRLLSPEQFAQAAVESVQALRMHALDCGGLARSSDRLEFSVRLASRGLSAQPPGREDKTIPVGVQVQASVWWHAVGRPEPILWDAWQCSSITREQIKQFAAFCEQLPDGPSVHEHANVMWLGTKSVGEPKITWRYHPERMRGLLPFESQVAKIGAASRGSIGQEAFQQIANAYLFSQRPNVVPVRLADPNSRKMNAVLEMLCFHAAYVGHGRQIFEFPAEVGEMFRETDVDEVTAESIKLPYPCVYLHFGPQADIEIEAGWRAEGAYVWEVKGENGVRAGLQFATVFAPADLGAYSQFELNVEPVYVQAIAREHLTLPLGKAVETVVQERIERLRGQAEGDPLAQDLKDAAVTEFAAEHGVELRSRQAEAAQHEREYLERLHRGYLEVLKLAVNALVYITAYPEDSRTVWPRAAPQSVVREARMGNREERRRAVSRLAAMGFTPVTICGEKVAGELGQERPSGTVATHWRRGHWRRQHHGPQNSSVKVIWLRPTLVSGKDNEPAGHVYRARERG